MAWPAYPEHRGADVVLRDGLTVQVRPADGLAVEQMLKRLSSRAGGGASSPAAPTRASRPASGRPRSTTTSATDSSRPLAGRSGGGGFGWLEARAGPAPDGQPKSEEGGSEEKGGESHDLLTDSAPGGRPRRGRAAAQPVLEDAVPGRRRGHPGHGGAGPGPAGVLGAVGSPGLATLEWGVIAVDQALHLSILAMLAVLLG
jgi:hypothetical protein